MVSDVPIAFKSGMVAIVGPPNVGKSTLLNALLGQKISIVSPKPQTTRQRIMGIVNGPDYQIVLLDTPGLHQARSPLNLEMMRIAVETLREVDLILYLVDFSLPLPDAEERPNRYLEADCPVVLLINKIDLGKKEEILPLLAAYNQIFPFAAAIPIAALTGDGTDRVVAAIRELLPAGPPLYPADIPTDATERFVVAEMIREKIFLHTGQEVPYATAVLVDSFKENSDTGLITIHATVFVEKQSQKGILIGKEGSRLKKIGQEARKDIEALLDQKVLLKLWVKVHRWSRDQRLLRELGF